jgi:hypothetical protein
MMPMGVLVDHVPSHICPARGECLAAAGWGDIFTSSGEEPTSWKPIDDGSGCGYHTRQQSVGGTMPLFRRPSGPGGPPSGPVMTINGRPQANPELPGTIQRRFRLFIECERRLAQNPLAQRDAVGTPLGDGLGLEGLVAQLAPVFERERRLIRWVALRGALTELFIRIFDPESAARAPQQLEQVMGLEWQTGSDGKSHPDIAPSWRSRLSSDQRAAALGVASSALIRAESYNRLEDMNIGDVINSSFWMPQAVAIDCIAWAAIALLRLEVAQELFSQVPEPDALPGPGWFTEPLFGKAQRYWDGSDWTSRCRVQEGRQYREAEVPLQ